MDIAISVKGVSKTFISQTEGIRIKALESVNLNVYSGEILGILGPNGAGKTTFLNILSTLLLPDSGKIEIFGRKLVEENFYILRKMFNMSSGHPNFPWSLTTEENLRFYGMLYGVSGPSLEKKITELIEMFGLKEFARQRFDELSTGTKQKLSLAKSLLGDPKVVFLDEPTAGLDPDVAIKTRQIILDIFKKTKSTILLTTHNMREAELMCQRIVFIRRGEIIRIGTPEDLKRMQKKKDLEEVFVELARESDKAEDPKNNLPIVSGTATTALEYQRENLFEMISFWLKRCFAFAYRNFLFSMRNLFAFIELIFWPVVSLLSIGLLGDFLQLQEKALAFIMTGAITAGVLQVTQLDVAYSLLYEVWSKSVKQTFLTPIGISEYLFGSWVIGVLRGFIIFCVLGVSAVLLFGFPFPPAHVIIIFLVGIFCSSLLLGMLVTFLILVFGQKAEITAWMFAYLFMLICGIYYPIDTLPKTFSLMAQGVPITYFLEYFRESFGFKPVLSYGLLKGFGLVFLYVFLGLKMMRFAFYKARKNGVIVRLSE